MEVFIYSFPDKVPDDIYKLLCKYEPTTQEFEMKRKPEHLTYWYKQALNSELLYGNKYREIIGKK